SASDGTGRSSALATIPPMSSATSAFAPCPAPRNLTTNIPSSVSTTAGSEPPSRSGCTYLCAARVGNEFGLGIEENIARRNQLARHILTRVALLRGDSARMVSSARRTGRYHLSGKPLHLFQLRTGLEQQKVDTSLREFLHTPRDLLRSPRQTCAETAIRHRVVLDADSLLELGVCDPISVVAVTRRSR